MRHTVLVPSRALIEDVPHQNVDDGRVLADVSILSCSMPILQATEPAAFGVDGSVGSSPVPEAVRFVCLMGVVETRASGSDASAMPRSISRAVGPRPRALRQASARLAELGRSGPGAGASLHACSTGAHAGRTGRRTPGFAPAGAMGVCGVAAAPGVMEGTLIARDTGRPVGLVVGGTGVGGVGVDALDTRALRGLAGALGAEGGTGRGCSAGSAAAVEDVTTLRAPEKGRRTGEPSVGGRGTGGRDGASTDACFSAMTSRTAASR